MEYADGYTAADAMAMETMAIGYYNPRYNSAKKGNGISKIFPEIHVDWKPVTSGRITDKKIRKREQKASCGKTKGEAYPDSIFDDIRNGILSSDSPTKYRDWCIINILGTLGIRLTDVVDLDLYDWKENELYIKRLDRRIKIGDEISACIRKYIAHRESGKESERAMFVSGQHKRISPKTIQYIVKTNGWYAGIDSLSVASLRECAKRRMENESIVNVSRRVRDLLR